ncbi:hypothetical protein SELMODRAFT_122637 [Selaginella moellendorffii]|uniref:peptidylprolyl isomerase n=2 Tax=Selaginella moellendorffii TaxID=88036 RepID=D8SQL3_SELML|nr:hypothetical protein SELMODRAFT_122637 [Selaginella moellendorffii]
MDLVDLTGDGGVMKRIVKRARPDALAPSDSLAVVDVHYEGTLAATGAVFDSSREDNAVFTFELGRGSVIRAWECAIKTMQVGEIAEIICKPEYAYGSEGSPPEIPPNATLVFEVELMDCKPRKGSTVNSVVAEKAKLDELRREREAAAAIREEEKKKREDAKAAAAARLQEKLNAKKGGKGKSSKSKASQ